MKAKNSVSIRVAAVALLAIGVPMGASNMDSRTETSRLGQIFSNM